MRKLLTTTAALAATDYTCLGSPSGLWDHNGSAMRLVYNDGHFGVYYEIVRPGLVQTIPPGSPRFEGTRTGNQITGNAFVYTKYCPGASFPYRVSGTVFNESRHRAVRTGGCRRSHLAIGLARVDNRISARDL